jgi:plasmid stabilization system protein ParE
MTVVWSSAARRDLLDVLEYIAADDPDAALAVVARIEDAITLLDVHPNMGRPGRRAGTRELIVTDTPYIVPYTIAGGRIRILRIWHGARRWPGQF